MMMTGPDREVISRRLARQQNTFVLAFAVLLILLVSSFFYQMRVSDVAQLRANLVQACEARNANIDTARRSLTIIGQGTDTYTRGQLVRAGEDLAKTDCTLFLP